VSRPIALGRSARAVLGVFAKHHKRAGDRLRYDQIFHNLGDAQIARTGQKELAQKGLVVAHPQEVELTETGYTNLLSDFGFQ